MTYETIKVASVILLAFVSIAILLWTLLPNKKDKFTRYSRIPLDAEEMQKSDNKEGGKQ